MHEETGLLVGKEDSCSLAKTIILLLEHPEVAAAMGRAGRLRAQQLFSLERYIDAYDDLYRKLITAAEFPSLNPR